MAIALTFPPRASAEVGITGSILTDDIYRGRSLGEGRPVATVSLSYDDASGAYLGLSTTGVLTAHSGAQWLGGQVSAGYARTVRPGIALDLGASCAHYTRYSSGGYAAEYVEPYIGVIGQRLSAHLYYSPNYYQQGSATLYAEIDTASRPWRDWRLTGHVGLLSRVSGPSARDVGRSQYDWRIGISKGRGRLDLSLAVTGTGPKPDYFSYRDRGANAILFGATRSF